MFKNLKSEGWHWARRHSRLLAAAAVLLIAIGTLPAMTSTAKADGTSNVTIELKDSSGNHIDTGTVSYYSGGWHTIGNTSGGTVSATLPTGTYSFQMSYNGQIQQLNGVTISGPTDDVVFQTLAVTVQLKDSNGNPLDTGSVSYYAGAWQPAQNTSGGASSFEMLPGSYSFAMVYNGSRQQLNGVDITSANPVVFQTGSVNIQFSGSAQWFLTNHYYNFAGPQELLPGAIGVYLTGSPLGRCDTSVTVTAGAHLNLSAVVATLSDSANHGTAGGVATAYVGSWQPAGTTNAAGVTCALLNGHLGNTSVAMVYNGTRQQLTQNQATNSIYAFKTTGVAIQLEDSNGHPLDTGNASYYAGGWQTIGATSGGVVSVQMLPGAYSFAMTYNGTRQQLNGVVISGTSDTVTFQTSLVNVMVQAHDNSALDIPGNGSASYYAGGWYLITAINPNNHYLVQAQMLPGTYSFAATYNGTRDQKSVTVGSSATTVYFHAALVTVALEAHDGNPLAITGNGSASYYAGGWHTITGSQVQAEMLPGSYSFAVTYNGTRDQQTATIVEPNPNNHANALQTVVFQTGQVESAGAATAYYASGWQPFAGSGELLPGSYIFSFTSGPNTAVLVTAGATTNIS